MVTDDTLTIWEIARPPIITSLLMVTGCSHLHQIYFSFYPCPGMDLEHVVSEWSENCTVSTTWLYISHMIIIFWVVVRTESTVLAPLLGLFMWNGRNVTFQLHVIAGAVNKLHYDYMFALPAIVASESTFSSVSLQPKWKFEHNRPSIDFKNTCEVAGVADKMIIHQTIYQHLAGSWC